MDLTLPVVAQILVNGNWYKIQYEGPRIICTYCGCYGHLRRNCSKKNYTDNENKETQNDRSGKNLQIAPNMAFDVSNKQNTYFHSFAHTL